MDLLSLLYLILPACLLLGVTWTTTRHVKGQNFDFTQSFDPTGSQELYTEAGNATLGPANAGAITAGSITITGAHTITDGNLLDVYWLESSVQKSRRLCVVGTVAGQVVPVSGGTGDTLPTGGTAVQCMVPRSQAFVVTGTNVQGLVASVKTNTTDNSVGPAAAIFNFCTAGPVEHFPVSVLRGQGYEWNADEGTANPITGDSIVSYYCSHNDTVNAWTMAVSALIT